MKKKLFFFATLLVAVVAAFGLSSCSQDDMPDTPNREGMVDVVMTTSMPQELQSYGVSSAEGGLKNLEGNGLKVRYIMEIYPKGSTNLVERKITYKNLEAEGDYRTASFTTRLLASEYNFVFWADIVKTATSIPYNQGLEGLDGSSYYANSYFFSNTDETSDVLWRPTDINVSEKGDLQTICASKVGAAAAPISSEMYDGYSCTELVDLRTEPTTQNFTLKRPFAKLRIITTDGDKLQADPDWSKTGASLDEGFGIPNQFNALTGKSMTSASPNDGYWALFGQRAGTYDNETENEHTLGVFYFPVPENAKNLSFKFNVYDASGNPLAQNISLIVENVPLVGNKLTTIKGNLLSKNATVNITIDDEFEDDETIIEVGKEASTVDALKAALTGKDETITYTGNVTKESGFELDFTNVARTTPVYAEDNNATLTLGFASIEEGAVLTFKGSNAPKTLRIKTDTKCSLCINLASSDVYYDGSSYKYIVTNAGCAGTKEDLQFDALFQADPGDGFFPADMSAAHQIKINADFTLPANPTCMYAKLHGGSCELISKLQTWFNSNSSKTMLDYVKENKD